MWSDLQIGNLPKADNRIGQGHCGDIAASLALRRAGMTKQVSYHAFRHYAEFRTMPSCVCAIVAQVRRISRDAIFLFGTIRHSPACFTGS